MLFRSKESDEWLGILDLANVRSLNEKISSGKISEVIKVSEALHEKKIGNIADKICSDKDINIILIAGPSSSGKTTFAQRLAVQLRVNGKRPILIFLMVLTKTKMGSPAIFKQPRIGKNEKIFHLYKFRTMTNELDEDGVLKSDEDRITKFGSFMRKSSLDELPSIINVIKGWLGM